MIVSIEDLISVVRPTLMEGRRVRMVVKGTSMLPFIRNGDAVELAPVDCAPVIGDAVLAQVAVGRYVVHRVVRADQDGVWLRGDSQRVAEGPVPATSVLGMVVAVCRGRRRSAMDRGPWSWLGRLWVSGHPLGPAALGVAITLWRALRRFSRLVWRRPGSSSGSS